MDETVNKLEIIEEDLIRGGKGWYKRKWKAIKNGTWNLYISKYYSHKSLGINGSFDKNSGSWDRDSAWSNKCFRIGLSLIWIEINFWIKWDFIAIIHKSVAHRNI